MTRLKRILSKFLIREFYQKLWLKIAIALFAVISVPIALMGISVSNNSGRAVRNSVLNNHKEIAVRAAEEIGFLLKRPEDVLSSTAAIMGTIHSDPWRQETVLVELALNQPVFIRVSSFGLAGEQIATSDLGVVFSRDYPRDALAEVSKGKSYVSGIRFQDNHIPYLTMAVPVPGDGRIKGALVADINLRGLWEIVDNIRLNQTGRTFLVSNDGTVIAHQDKKLVLKNDNFFGQKDVNAVLKGNSGAVEVRDKEGRRWVSGYAPILNTGWGVILRQEKKEAYLFSCIMNIQTCVVIILSEIMAALLVIFITRLFTNPIQALVSRIKGVTAGDPEDKIKTKRHDEIGQLVKIFNDLTGRLKQAKENEKFSSIGEAAVWVAHELKNSLFSIKSFVQMFPERHNDEKFLDKYSQLIPEEISRLERMLKELSDFSSSSKLIITRANIKGILDCVLKILEDKFSENRIELQYIIKNSNLKVDCDPERMKQVFINLVINAISAMPKGGVLTVSLDLTKNSRMSGSSCVEASITDTGDGIPQDRLKNIFAPFKTTKQEGTGLGLAICHRIVGQHGGDIEVKSQPGQGTTFTVRLPMELNILLSKDRVRLDRM